MSVGLEPPAATSMRSPVADLIRSSRSGGRGGGDPDWVAHVAQRGYCAASQSAGVALMARTAASIASRETCRHAALGRRCWSWPERFVPLASASQRQMICHRLPGRRPEPRGRPHSPAGNLAPEVPAASACPAQRGRPARLQPTGVLYLGHGDLGAVGDEYRAEFHCIVAEREIRFSRQRGDLSVSNIGQIS